MADQQVNALPTISGLLDGDFILLSRDGVVIGKQTVAAFFSGLSTDNIPDGSGVSENTSGTLTGALLALDQRLDDFTGTDGVTNQSSVAGTTLTDALDDLQDQIDGITGAAAEDVAYTPADAGDWGSTVPDNVGDALDFAVARLSAMETTYGTGDVTGPVTSTATALARYSGTTGKVLANSPVLVGDNGELTGFRVSPKVITATSYTLLPEDTGRPLEFSNASTISVTVPGSLPKGWTAPISAVGAGEVQLVTAGATIRNRSGHTKLAGQWGMGAIYVRENSGGSAAEVLFGGDTVA